MEKKISLAKKIQDIFLRYPLVLLMSATMSCMIINNVNSFVNTHNKLIIIILLGIPVMFSLKMLAQRTGKEWLLQTIGLLFLSAYYFMLPNREDRFSVPSFFLLVTTFILAHLAVSFAPFLSAQTSEKSFWQYNKNLFVNFVLTGIFSGVLTVGVELAVAATQALFDLHFSSKVYLDIFLIINLFGNTLIFLLFSKNGLSTLEENDKYPVSLKFFTQFILFPLLLIYIVLLYLYSVKILLKWQLPHGWVSFLILAYSSIGIFALLLVYPLKEISSKSWVKGYSRFFYFSLIPLVLLLFIAIFTRVWEYGFTEARYFVMLLAVWLACMVMYFIFVQKASIKFIPITFFLCGLFALTVPYFNAFSVANRSQKYELEKLLTENKLLKNGKIDFDKPVADSVAESIADKFYFLLKRRQNVALAQYFSKETIEKVCFPLMLKGKFHNITNVKNTSVNADE